MDAVGSLALDIGKGFENLGNLIDNHVIGEAFLNFTSVTSVHWPSAALRSEALKTTHRPRRTNCYQQGLIRCSQKILRRLEMPKIDSIKSCPHS